MHSLQFGCHSERLCFSESDRAALVAVKISGHCLLCNCVCDDLFFVQRLSVADLLLSRVELMARHMCRMECHGGPPITNV